MRKIIITLAAVVALAGCTTVGGSLSAVCSALGVTHQGFITFTTLHPVSANIMAAELSAYTDGTALCADRGTLTVTQAIIRIVAATARIAELLQTSERATGALAAP